MNIDKPIYREARWEPTPAGSGTRAAELIYAPHVCQTPENWDGRKAAWAEADGTTYPQHPRYPEDAIWQCQHCRRYYHYLARDRLMYEGRYWLPVRWWNLTAKRHIKEARNRDT